jgi:hypothetical protein
LSLFCIPFFEFWNKIVLAMLVVDGAGLAITTTTATKAVIGGDPRSL